MTTQKPLFVVHHHTTCSGVIGQWAHQWAGCFSSVHAPNGLPNPHTLEQPVVVFGGNMSSNSSEKWVRDELFWLETLLERKHPVFAICLGAQMLAKVLGQQVFACPQGSLECGYHPLLNPSVDLPRHVYQWHKEGFSSKGFDRDVRVHAHSPWNGETCQAFSTGNAWGVQFHPEITPERIAVLIAKLPHEVGHPSAKPARSHFADHQQHAPSVQRWLSGVLMEQWAPAISSPLAARKHVR